VPKLNRGQSLELLRRVQVQQQTLLKRSQVQEP